MQKLLVLGASGATGRLVVADALKRSMIVTAIVRDGNTLSELSDHDELTVVEGDLLTLSESVLLPLVESHDAVVCCLGHNLTFKGMYGHPRRLVTDATQLITQLMKTPQRAPKQKKFILMNSTGCRNKHLNEVPPLSQRIVIGLLRMLLPPHSDNESAVEYLHQTSSSQVKLGYEWVAVRPDALTDEDRVTEYEVCPSPVRNAIFDSGMSSRINVAHFMVSLVEDDRLWQKWRSQTPVVYNQIQSK